jgi:hypothetical protein
MRIGAEVMAVWRVWKASTAAGGRGKGKDLRAEVRSVRGAAMVEKFLMNRR